MSEWWTYRLSDFLLFSGDPTNRTSSTVERFHWSGQWFTRMSTAALPPCQSLFESENSEGENGLVSEP